MKAILYLKKLWWIFLIVAVWVLYLILRKQPTAPPIDDPITPEDIIPPDLLGRLRQSKEATDAKIRAMSRSDLVDDINSTYE